MRLLTATLAWVAAVALAVAPVGAGSAIAAPESVDNSAVTVSGTGPFSALKVTVSQTEGLIDQVVRVSWSGASPTPIGFPSDYLQIMQCWGEDPTGPQRDHCEFGNSADTRGGPQVTTRQLDAGTTFTDPNETQVATPQNPYNYVPFISHIPIDDPANPGQTTTTVAGDRTSLGQLFDSQSTNELPLNATGADGTGEAYFETQTAQEAPGLGCGDTDTAADGTTSTPYCWLVVVPRGETEVNGAPSSDNGAGLVSSPLSASNWANHIAIPLTFAPVGISCPIGSPEQRTNGQEMAQEATARWNAQLCKTSGTVFSFAKTSDDAARRQLMTSSPGLDFISQPVDPTTSGSSDIVYAPVALSGAVIGFNIDYSPYGANNLRPLAGQRVPDINLTPRLVAKLITQSYSRGAPQGDPVLTQAPQGLTYDPDFAQANPGLAGLDSGGGDVLMPFAPSDVTQQLWAWINADPDAKAFLDGTPDPWGMTVNPAYLKITDNGIPTSFPKNDTYCSPQFPVLGTQPPDLCTLDNQPYANDMHDAARSASRGDNLSRAQWDPSPPQPHYKKVPLQLSGLQSVMAFTDAATAARFSLSVAHLENGAGAFVSPTTAGLLAGVGAMAPSAVPAVLGANPRMTDPAAYPLTSITYAATRPVALSPAARSDYADYLQYAVTSGQKSGDDIGELPIGYAPLTQQMVTQALVASVAIRTFVAPATTSAPVVTTPAPTKTAKPKPKPTPRPTKTAEPKSTTKPKPAKTTPAPTTPPAVPTSTYTAPAIQPVTTLPTTQAIATTSQPTPPPITTTPAPATTTTSVTPSSAAAPTSGDAPSLAPVAEIRPTPAVDAGGSRYVFVVLLALGGLSALSGPTLLRLGRRR